MVYMKLMKKENNAPSSELINENSDTYWYGPSGRT